jgi:F-type H+-transporting ATPase subunit b
MSDLVHQLGELFLRAVPVAVIVLLFYIIMRSIFFQPLLKVMAERDARTIGAQKAAEAAQAAAAEKVRQYEEALRQARARVYAEQEADRRKLVDERAATLKDARAKADAEVNAAKAHVVGEFAGAKKEIEAITAQLAAEIARRILQSSPSPGTPTREAR